MTASRWQERVSQLLKEYDPALPVKTFEDLVTEEKTIHSWEDFQHWLTSFTVGGCFRGHREASWNLTTTLDRAVLKAYSIDTYDIHSTNLVRVNPQDNERAVLVEFQRGAHHYHATTPTPDHVVDWLALMQHYGAPTRLLDWTRSPYVALYFAMQEESNGDAALWAIDLQWFEERSSDLLHQHNKDCPDGSDFRAACEYTDRILFREDNPYVIVSASPMRLNERMLAQRGHLLCSLRNDNVAPFSAVFLGMLIQPSVVDRQVVSKIVIDKGRRISFLEKLRQMNIHSASLFPGLDGFARSLAVTLDIAVADQLEARKRREIEDLRKLQEISKTAKTAGERVW